MTPEVIPPHLRGSRMEASADRAPERCGFCGGPLSGRRNPGIADRGRLWLDSPMEIRRRDEQAPFTTKDGSTIRSLLDRTNAPVSAQSLAEAVLEPGTATERHYHLVSEEFYYVLEGRGWMEVGGVEREVVAGDAVLIPAGAWHGIRAEERLCFLCCCAPPYSHEDTYFA